LVWKIVCLKIFIQTIYKITRMDQLLNQLKTQKMTIIVAIPMNSVELALAAQENGADAIKVHINMIHRASKVEFGSLEDERQVLSEILAACRIPVGIVPGASLDVSTGLITELATMGFDFFDMFARFMTPELLDVPGISRMAAVDSTIDWSTISEIGKEGIQMLEGAIIPSTGYGERLSIIDLAQYRLLRKATTLPLIIPSQRTLVPSDIPLLFDVGVQAVLLGVLSTGSEATQLGQQIAFFRNAIDKL